MPEAAAAIQPQVRWEDRDALDQRDKEKLLENAVKQLSTKFSIMGGLTSQGKTQLESTYSITMLLQALKNVWNCMICSMSSPSLFQTILLQQEVLKPEQAIY